MSLSTTATSTATKLSAFIASKVSSPASRKAKMDTATRNFIDTLLDAGEKGRTLSLMTNLAKFGNYLADKNIAKLNREQAERGGSL